MGRSRSKHCAMLAGLLATLKEPEPPKGQGRLEQTSALSQGAGHDAKGDQEPLSGNRDRSRCGRSLPIPIQTCWPADAGPLITWGLVVTWGRTNRA